MDFVEASHRHKVYPVMYCHMKIAGNLDIDRLKAAVQYTRYYVELWSPDKDVFYVGYGVTL